MSSVVLHRIVVKRYKCLADLSWLPSTSTNLIIGGGDHGKSTLLDAVGLLFHPSNSKNLTSTDYYNKNVDDGFEIKAVISVSDDFEFSSGAKMYWPWEWDGTNAVQPCTDHEDEIQNQNPVYRVVVMGTEELELRWQVIQPDGSREHFSVGARRQAGLVSLTNEDSHDRDLRFVYGSALDRLLADSNFRSRVMGEIAKMSFTDQLSEDSKSALDNIDETFQQQLLPSELSLGMTGGHGVSIGSLLGIFSEKNGVSLPLTRWGTGTKRLASLYLTKALQEHSSLALIDEVEKGLEPYRLRKIIRLLADTGTQCFITTHSPIALSLLDSGALWYLDAQQNIGELALGKIKSQLRRDPETFLSKVAVIVEGETEQGFVEEIVRKLLGDDPANLGVRVANGQGDELLPLLETLNSAQLCFCGFADNDTGNSGRWGSLRDAMGNRLFQWETGCMETNIIQLIPDAGIERLLQDEDGDWDGNRLRTLADRLGCDSKDFDSLMAHCDNDRGRLKECIIEASTGDATMLEEGDRLRKQWKKHGQQWFKKADGSGGRELLRHLEQTNQWSSVELNLRPFFNEILKLCDVNEVQNIVL